MSRNHAPVLTPSRSDSEDSSVAIILATHGFMFDPYSNSALVIPSFAEECTRLNKAWPPLMAVLVMQERYFDSRARKGEISKAKIPRIRR